MDSRFRLLATIALYLLSTAAWGDDRFHARFSENLRSVDAELCFQGAAPDRIYRSSRASGYASPLRHDGAELDARARGTRVELPPLPRDACLSWTVDLGAALDQGDERTALRMGNAVYALTTLWFWKGPWQRPLVATVDVPAGMSFSTPWPRAAGTDGPYRPVRTPAGWMTRSAVGEFTLEALAVPGGVVELALLGALTEAQGRKLTQWIRTTVDAVTPVFGVFPRPHTQVVVVPLGRRGEAVPWAHVIRGGGPAVHFYVDETRPLSEFDGDWTATHEFSHLLLPYVARDDRWLSEGLASYYQNVLRARDGRLAARDAWQKLDEGFRRGVNATRRETLEEAARGGRGSTMRIYWSGAAMMLQADTALRDRSGGETSLDSVLKQFLDCCYVEGKRWRAREVMATLDRLSGTDVFMTVYEENRNRLAFPDYQETYDALGLERRSGRIRLAEQAPLMDIREGIMRGAPGESSADRGTGNAH